MVRFSVSIGLMSLALALPAWAADFSGAAPAGRFVATCEDLAELCFAESCGRDQIEAALRCRARCPGSVVLTVAPTACAVPERSPGIVLRRRG